MYNISDKKTVVTQIQKFLSDIQNDKNIIITGKYDSRTQMAVTEYQKARMLTATGIVNYKTWNSLYRDWVNALDTRNIYGIEFPLKIGDYNSDVAKVKAQVRKFGEYYGDYEWYDQGLLYSKNFGNEVRRIRNILRQNDGTEYDLILYLRIEKELKLRELIKNNGSTL